MIVTFLFCSSACAALAHSMPKYRLVLVPGPPSRLREQGWRGFGWALMALAMASSIGAVGASGGSVLWFGASTVAALATGMMLTYRPRWTMRSVAILVPLALCATAIQWL